MQTLRKFQPILNLRKTMISRKFLFTKFLEIIHLRTKFANAKPGATARDGRDLCLKLSHIKHLFLERKRIHEQN